MKVRANAKINLSLGLCGKREDGYHLIDTVMHSVDLYDELIIKKADNITVKCDKNDIEPQKNIVFLAAQQFFSDYAISGGADIAIKKNIPYPAGLGGGSADAAAVLLALNKLYAANIDGSELEKTALKLGADVPFFIKGGCCRAEGIGERLTRVEPLKTGYILLAKAEQKPSTAQMYRLADQKPYVQGDTRAVINAVKDNNLFALSKGLFNAFADIWGESPVRASLLEQSPLGVSLSGSGPTWFAVFDDKEKAIKATAALKGKGIDCWLTTPQPKAIIFE